MNFITINIQSLSSVQEEEADVGEKLAYLVGWMGMRKCGDESNSGTWNENGVASGRLFQHKWEDSGMEDASGSVENKLHLGIVFVVQMNVHSHGVCRQKSFSFFAIRRLRLPVVWKCFMRTRA